MDPWTNPTTLDVTGHLKQILQKITRKYLHGGVRGNRGRCKGGDISTEDRTGTCGALAIVANQVIYAYLPAMQDLMPFGRNSLMAYTLVACINLHTHAFLFVTRALVVGCCAAAQYGPTNWDTGT